MTQLENTMITEEGFAVINIVLTCYWKAQIIQQELIFVSYWL
jgi:hypothetical protein